MPFFPDSPVTYVGGGASLGGGSGISLGGGGGAAPGSTKTRQQNTASNKQKFNDPALVDALSKSIGGLVGNSAQQFSDYIQNPTQSPLFQQSLQTMLNDLQPGEAAQRQSLQDQFRQSGALNSGAFANAATANERNIGMNRSTTATNLLGQTYGATLQGLLGAVGQGNPLIQGLKMSEGQSQGTSSTDAQAYAPSGGGGGSSVSMGQPFAPPIAPGTAGGSPGYYGSLTNPNPGPSGGPSYMSPDLSNYNWGDTAPDYLNYY